MNEKERELRQKMAAKTEEIRGLMNEGKLDDAEQATEELRRLKRELQIETTLGENSVDTVPPEELERMAECLVYFLLMRNMS